MAVLSAPAAAAYREEFTRIGWLDHDLSRRITSHIGGATGSALGESPVLFAPVNGRPGLLVAATVDGRRVLGQPRLLRGLTRQLLGVPLGRRRPLGYVGIGPTHAVVIGVRHDGTVDDAAVHALGLAEVTSYRIRSRRRAAEGEVILRSGGRSIGFTYREFGSSFRAKLLRPLRQFIAIRSNFSGHRLRPELQRRWVLGYRDDRKALRGLLERFARDVSG